MLTELHSACLSHFSWQHSRSHSRKGPASVFPSSTAHPSRGRYEALHGASCSSAESTRQANTFIVKAVTLPRKRDKYCHTLFWAACSATDITVFECLHEPLQTAKDEDQAEVIRQGTKEQVVSNKFSTTSQRGTRNQLQVFCEQGSNKQQLYHHENNTDPQEKSRQTH